MMLKSVPYKIYKKNKKNPRNLPKTDLLNSFFLFLNEFSQSNKRDLFQKKCHQLNKLK